MTKRTRSSRLRTSWAPLIAGLLAGTVVVSGCGGGGATASAPAAPGSTGASHSSQAPAPAPTYRLAAVRKQLLAAREVGPALHPQSEGEPEAWRRRRINICAQSTIKPAHSPQLISRQLVSTDRNGVNFRQLVLLYPDAKAAATVFAQIRAAVQRCRAKEQVAKRTLPGSDAFVPAHRAEWHWTENTIHGWSHLRAIEKDTYDPAATSDSVLPTVFDYVQRGNLLVASMYWRRVEPETAMATISGPATETLQRQLSELDCAQSQAPPRCRR